MSVYTMTPEVILCDQVGEAHWNVTVSQKFGKIMSTRLLLDWRLSI